MYERGDLIFACESTVFSLFYSIKEFSTQTYSMHCHSGLYQEVTGSTCIGIDKIKKF